MEALALCKRFFLFGASEPLCRPPRPFTTRRLFWTAAPFDRSVPVLTAAPYDHSALFLTAAPFFGAVFDRCDGRLPHAAAAAALYLPRLDAVPPPRPLQRLDCSCFIALLVLWLDAVPPPRPLQRLERRRSRGPPVHGPAGPDGRVLGPCDL